MKRRRSGFTFIELLTVTAIIGILAGLAVSRYSAMKKRAFAASIFADVHAIRIAIMTNHTETGTFPPDAAPGQVPPEIENYLPNGFTFVKQDWTYDWQTWNSGWRDVVGVRVSSTDKQLISHLFKAGGAGFIPIATSSDVTFLLAEH